MANLKIVNFKAEESVRKAIQLAALNNGYDNMSAFMLDITLKNELVKKELNKGKRLSGK